MTAKIVCPSGKPLLLEKALRETSLQADTQFKKLHNPHYTDYYRVVPVETAAVGRQEAETKHNEVTEDCFSDFEEESSGTSMIASCSVSTCLPAMSLVSTCPPEDTGWNPQAPPDVPPLPTKLMWAKREVPPFSTRSTSGNTPQHVHGQDLQEQFSGMCSALNASRANEVAANSGSALPDGSCNDNSCNDNPEGELLTVMLKNIPCRCDKEEIMKLLELHGWADKCNYFHIPRRPSSANVRGSLGYVFVGFPDAKLTRQFMHEMKGKQFPGRKSGKVLDVAPARLQQAEGTAQVVHKKIRKRKDKSQDQTEQLGGSPTTHDCSEGCENTQGTTALPWNPLQAASSQDMWNAAYWSQFKQQAYNVEELAMQAAGAGSFGPAAQWYGCSTGFAGPQSMQPMPENDHWSLNNHPWIPHFAGTKEDGSWSSPIDTTTEHVVEQAASEVSSLSMEFEDVEEAGSEWEAGTQRQDNSDSGLEFKDIEQEDAAVALCCSEDDHHGAAVGSSFYDARSEEEEEDTELLTVMLKNIPCRCSQQDILDLLADHGWEDAYNFFHLPSPPSACKGWRGCLGYAFVGFKDSETTFRFMEDMKGRTFPNRNSTKVIDVVPARYQGLEHNLAQFTGKKLTRSAKSPIYRREDEFQDVIATMKF